MPKKSSKSGFTLIELMVTISIIAILSAIGLVVYSSVLKQGRDSKRQSDLRSIQSALEQYNADQFFYPSGITPGNALTSNTGQPNSSPNPKTYINTIPQDSNVATPYRYVALRNGAINCDNSLANQCNSYCLYSKLDIPGSIPSYCSSFAPAGYNFAVTPP